MNLQETIDLIGALKKAGATHFKSADFEVTLGKSTTRQEPDQITMAEPKSEIPEATINQANTKKAEDLIEMLTMKDDQLIDRIFPDGAL